MKASNLIFCVLAAVLLASCSDSPYERAQNQFLAQCQQTGAPKVMCKCISLELTTNFGEERITKLYSNSYMNSSPALREELTNASLKATMTCLKKQ